MEIAHLTFKTQPFRFKPTAPATKTKTTAHSILLIEHHPESHQAHLNLLRLMGCRVDLATTGQEAIKMSHHPYDLILMDTHLPDFCSIKLSKIIKEHHYPITIPIIAFTHCKKTKKHANIDDLIPKPLKPEKLISLLSQWLK